MRDADDESPELTAIHNFDGVDPFRARRDSAGHRAFSKPRPVEPSEDLLAAVHEALTRARSELNDILIAHGERTFTVAVSERREVLRDWSHSLRLTLSLDRRLPR